MYVKSYMLYMYIWQHIYMQVYKCMT